MEAGTSRHRHPGWAGGCGFPVGNGSPACCGPLRPLSSQSGQGVSPGGGTAIHSISAPEAPLAAAIVPSENAASTWSAARPSTRSPFHSRNADPMCSTDDGLLGPVEAVLLEQSAAQRPGQRFGQLVGDPHEGASPDWGGSTVRVRSPRTQRPPLRPARAPGSADVANRNRGARPRGGSRSLDQVAPLDRRASSRSFW